MDCSIEKYVCIYGLINYLMREGLTMPRYCMQCEAELAKDERELCTCCQFYKLKDEFEAGNLG